MTAVQQPLTISEPSIPQRRRRLSADIIDVDMLDDDDIVNFQRHFPRRMSERPTAYSRDTITIVDSDDEQPATLLPQHAHRNRNAFFSPPPPPLSTAAPPPVPRIPPHLATQSALPMRRRAPAWPGVIRPNQDPFPFEATIRPATPPLAAAPPSHHVPAMSLGGALISLNNQLTREEDVLRRAEQSRRQRTLEQNIGRRVSTLYRAAIRRFSDGYVLPGQGDADEFFAQILASEDAAHDARRFAHLPRAAEKQQYLPSFTHPAGPAPGFTFDFGPSSPSPSPKLNARPPIIDVDAGPVASTSALPAEDASTLLVCARCLDPLVLGGNDVRTRLWGLRCGHLLDGKCIEEIMKPLAAGADIGKGKQKEVVPPDEGSRTTDSPESAPEQEPEVSPIRSRLRPRTYVVGGPSTSHTRQHDAQGSPHGRRRRYFAFQSTNRNTYSPPTSRGPVEVPHVEATQEWTCPVAGCGRVHVALRVGGRWVQDGERGAIAVYA